MVLKNIQMTQLSQTKSQFTHTKLTLCQTLQYCKNKYLTKTIANTDFTPFADKTM